MEINFGRRTKPYAIVEKILFGFGIVKTATLNLTKPKACIVVVVIGSTTKCRINMVVSQKVLNADSNLVQIADTMNLVRSSHGLTQCWQQQRRENPDDGNNDQEFNQRERQLNSLPP